MKLTFIKNCEVEIVTRCNEAGDTIETAVETFNKGESIDIDLLDFTNQYLDIQFQDGSVAYEMPREFCEYIDDRELDKNLY